jgi:hypothetical protein
MLRQTECGKAVRHTASFRYNERHSRPPGAFCQSAISPNFPDVALIRAIFLHFLFAIAAAILLLAGSSGARAQDGIMMKGDAVVTGFSGIKPADAPLPEGASPLDEFFIDFDGPSAQILSLGAPGTPPSGELISTPPALQVYAKQVGQVFATALDDGLGAGVPNIYLGQTLAYGAHIVLPDNDGDGWPERLKTGAAGAQWMAGQFGGDPEGGPGAIYKVDGISGAVTLFATLPGNSGAGIGDIVFDTETRQFFVSDLDNGLVYRLSETGDVIDSFDHGTDGRPADGLDAVADDGKTADIENAAFDIEKPETWGFTQEERRVHGLAIREGRLFYAADDHVWSVAISAEGFGEVQWELDAENPEADGPITDMLFDNDGRLYLSRRGEQRGSYDFSVYAEPEKSDVVRYSLEDPDDPATKSRWVEDPEEYAIGMPEDHRQAEGGIALGYPYDENGFVRVGACGEMLWSTGHRLLPSTPPAEGEEAENDVHGLQGNAISLVRPENVPPQQSYFSDYDGFFGDAAKSGHVGDVEIWQPCEGVSQPDYGFLPPGILPPGDIPPDLPPEFPDYDYETNLELTKRANPKECSLWFGGWLCEYRIRVRNTGPDDYFGPVLIEDWLPADPVGAAMGFSPTPPWTCWNTGSNAYSCFRPGVFLAPGASIGLTAYVWVPKDYGKCNLRNAAAITWAPGGSQWNTDPFDDEDWANALIPSEECEDPEKETDLKIYKRAIGDCFEHDGGLRCGYRVTVENQGPGPYNGNIVVDDTVPAGTDAIFSGPPGMWLCPGASPNYTCTAAGVSLPVPGASVSFTVRVDLSHERAKELGCRVRNRVKIVHALGGSPMNTDPTNDTASAVANVPAELCTDEPEKTDLKIYKRALSCYRTEDGPRCAYRVTVRNLGPGQYDGDIKVKDMIPAGMSATFSSPDWACGGPAPTYTCTNAAASLPVNGTSSFIVRVDFTPEQARQNNCRIRNRVEITQAPGGTPKNTNPANDVANAVANVPDEICKLGLRTNLRIDKKANPTFCSRWGGGWWCSYAIRVANMGPGTYVGPLEVEEALPGEPENANWNAPWNCAGIGGGGGAICKHPNTVMAPLTSRILHLNVKFSDDLVKEKNCALPNVAKITVAPGGTPKNTNPADDIAGDSAKVPAEFCEKEPANLLLLKQGAQPECNTTGGGLYRCPFNVFVRNTGPGKYDGPITVQDELPAAAAGATMEVPAPWVCVGAAPSITCKHPAVQLNPGQQVVMPVNVLLPPANYGECHLTNTARILQAAGGSVQNQNPGDDEDSATLNFPPLLVTGGPAYCHTAVPSTQCPPGYEWDGEGCERSVSTPPPPPPRPTTPEVDEECPDGYRGTPPNCRRIIVQPDPDPVCTGGRILRNGECVCRRGRVWNGERCVRPRPQCTGGRILRNGECVCRGRLVWNGERCVRPRPQCTGGRILRNGECVCRGRLVWNGKSCVRPEPQCTGGRVLVKGRCVCRRGRVWNGERCVRAPVLRPTPQLRVPETRPTPKLRIPPRLLNPNQGNNIR